MLCGQLGCIITRLGILRIAGAALASSFIPSNSLPMYISIPIYLSMFVSNFLLPDVEVKRFAGLADFDEIWQTGLSRALVVCLRRVAPRPLRCLATGENPPI